MQKYTIIFKNIPNVTYLFSSISKKATLQSLRRKRTLYHTTQFFNIPQAALHWSRQMTRAQNMSWNNHKNRTFGNNHSTEKTGKKIQLVYHRAQDVIATRRDNYPFAIRWALKRKPNKAQRQHEQCLFTPWTGIKGKTKIKLCLFLKSLVSFCCGFLLYLS